MNDDTRKTQHSWRSISHAVLKSVIHFNNGVSSSSGLIENGSAPVGSAAHLLLFALFGGLVQITILAGRFDFLQELPSWFWPMTNKPAGLLYLLLITMGFWKLAPHRAHDVTRDTIVTFRLSLL